MVSSKLIACLGTILVALRISDELSSDIGPEFTAATTQEFLTVVSTTACLSSFFPLPFPKSFYLNN